MLVHLVAPLLSLLSLAREHGLDESFNEYFVNPRYTSRACVTSEVYIVLAPLVSLSYPGLLAIPNQIFRCLNSFTISSHRLLRNFQGSKNFISLPQLKLNSSILKTSLRWSV